MNTKEKILQTSLELFSKDGYEAVSVSDIAGSVGLTKGALYKHYKNKRDIFDCIVQRMREYDYENAKRFETPENLFENMPGEYRKTEIEMISAYAMAQFVFWTEDSFAANFRKLLSIERWRNAEMEQMYQQFLGLGPISYTAELLAKGICAGYDKTTVEKIAFEFYSPIYMLIDLYSGAADKAAIAHMLKEHIEKFVKKLQNLESI